MDDWPRENAESAKKNDPLRHQQAVGGGAGVLRCRLEATGGILLHAAVGEGDVAGVVVAFGGPAAGLVGGEFENAVFQFCAVGDVGVAS